MRWKNSMNMIGDTGKCVTEYGNTASHEEVAYPRK